MKFKVITTREAEGHYIASCPDMAGAVAHGNSKETVLKGIRAVIRKKLDDGSDDSAALKPHPVSPPPRGPIVVEIENPHENSDA